MRLLLVNIFTIFLFTYLISADSNLKCLVCQNVVSSIISAIDKEDPKKMLEIGSFRIQPDGTQKKTQVKYAGSEIHLHEILGNICDSMNDYAQAKHKETGDVALLNLSTDIDKLSTYELVPDPDLNRNLKYYCESFIEEYDEDIMKVLGSSSKMNSNREMLLCHSKSGYCKSDKDNDANHQEL